MRGDVVRASRAAIEVAPGVTSPVRGNVIDGAAIAERVQAEVRSEVERLKTGFVVSRTVTCVIAVELRAVGSDTVRVKVCVPSVDKSSFRAHCWSAMWGASS